MIKPLTIKYVFLSILYFTITTACQSQIKIEPRCLMLEADDVEQIFIEIEITNNGPEAIGLVWEFEPADDFPEDWKFQITDKNIDYNWGIAQSVTSLTNNFEAGEKAFFNLRIENIQNNSENFYNISGSSSGTLKLYDNTDFLDPITETSCTVSNNNIEAEALLIYPNPTNDRFHLSDDGDITSMKLYDIVGRQLMTMNHKQGMQYDISYLENGIYIVSLENKDGKVLKNTRLCKR